MPGRSSACCSGSIQSSRVEHRLPPQVLSRHRDPLAEREIEASCDSVRPNARNSLRCGLSRAAVRSRRPTYRRLRFSRSDLRRRRRSTRFPEVRGAVPSAAHGALGPSMSPWKWARWDWWLRPDKFAGSELGHAQHARRARAMDGPSPSNRRHADLQYGGARGSARVSRRARRGFPLPDRTAPADRARLFHVMNMTQRTAAAERDAHIAAPGPGLTGIATERFPNSAPNRASRGPPRPTLRLRAAFLRFRRARALKCWNEAIAARGRRLTHGLSKPSTCLYL